MPEPKRTPPTPYVDPAANEVVYTDDETEFMMAMDAYKRRNHRPFPAWSEVLTVLLSLGYRKGCVP